MNATRLFCCVAAIFIAALAIGSQGALANVWILSLPKEGAGVDKSAPAPSRPPANQAPQAHIKTGTAFFINDSGLLVTNYHVIAGTKQQLIGDTQTGNSHYVRVVYTDKANDLALLQANVRSRPIPLATANNLTRGEEVLTLGHPSPTVIGAQQRATFGRVNALTGLRDDKRFVQVDLPIQPGNSGGPLLNRQGEVVGIVTSRLPGGYQNVNYALKVEYLHQILRSLSINISTKRTTAPMSLEQIVTHFQSSVVMLVAG